MKLHMCIDINVDKTPIEYGLCPTKVKATVAKNILVCNNTITQVLYIRSSRNFTWVSVSMRARHLVYHHPYIHIITSKLCL